MRNLKFPILCVALLAAHASALAGQGTIGVYCYDLKTGGQTLGISGHLVGSGGTVRDLVTGDYNLQFDNLPTTETYTITISKTGYFSRSIPAIIVSNARTRNYSLALTPTTGVGTTFNMSGRVVNGLTGAGIAGAMVSGYRASGNRAIYAMADGSGNFVIPNCIPGGYAIGAEKAASQSGQGGYLDSTSYSVAATGAVSDIVLPCTPESAPSVPSWQLLYYYDAMTGGYIRGMELQVRAFSGTTNVWTMRLAAWDGITLERLPAALTYNVIATYTNANDPRQYYPSTRVGARLVEGVNNRWDFYLVPRDLPVGSSNGAVRNMMNGVVVPGAMVDLYYGGRPLHSMVTLADGLFSFTNVPANYLGLTLYVSKPGWTTHGWEQPPLNVGFNSNDLFTVNRSNPLGGIRTRVRDWLTGAYMDDATVRITLPTGQSTLTRARYGNYTEYPGLPAWLAGGFDVSVSAAGYLSTAYLGLVPPYDRMNDATFWLERSAQTVGRLVGRVRDLFTGNAIVGAIVTSNSQVRTNATGDYAMANHPLGSASVSVTANGYNSASTMARVVSGDNPLDFFLVPVEYPSGGCWGYIRDVTSGSDVINATVTIAGPGGLTRSYFTGPDDGYYECQGLPHDRPFSITASAPGYQSSTVSNWYPQNGNQSSNIPFDLMPNWGASLSAPRLNGRADLRGFSGDVANVWLTLEAYQDGSLMWRADTRMQPDGSFSVPCPMDMPADLRLKPDRWTSVTLPNFSFDTQRELGVVTFSSLGDTNNDDAVDDADLTAVMLAYGALEANAPDLDGNGVVDDADLTLALANYGAIGEGGQR